jgi:hypothetical protein
MTSVRHEGLVSLFQNRPALAPELLRDRLGAALPAYSEARLDSANLTEVVPMERYADLVVLLVEGKPVFAIVVEVQLSRDEDKRRSWPQYAVNLHTRLRCPTAVLVVAPEESVARWCAQPIEVGPAHTLQPHVLGPQAIPVVVDEQVARQCPELVVLSAMAHGKSEVGPAIAEVALSVARQLEGKRAALYIELTLSSLADAARIAFEKLMQNPNYEYQTEYARKYFEGVAKAHQEGHQEGRKEALCEGQQRSLLAVLSARGLTVSAEAREHMLACTDPDQLQSWLLKALTATSTSEIFEQGPRRSP